MKTLLTACLVLCFVFNGIAFSQNDPKTNTQQPDFSGTWEYVGEISKGVTARLLTIKQVGETVTIEESFLSNTTPWIYQIILFTDNRGEKNLLPIRNSNERITVASRTKWIKNKLVRTMSYTSVFESAVSQGSVQHRDTETYGFAKDGTSLVIEVVAARESTMATGPTRTFHKRTYRRRI